VELTIALHTTLLWDVSGIEGERGQLGQQEQVVEVSLEQWMKSWWTEMKR